MNARTKDFTDARLKELISFNEKVGVNSLGFKMLLSSVKAIAKDEADRQSATEYIVSKLQDVKLWTIARVSFDMKETYSAEYLKFQYSQWEKGNLLKCPVTTNRFVVKNPITKEYYATGINFGKTTLTQEAIRFEIATGEKANKKSTEKSIK